MTDTCSCRASIDLAIVICTFHREALLRDALAALAAQRSPPDLTVELLVVDNSDTGTAEAVVAEAARQTPFPVRYLSAHPANISVARNAGVAATKAAYVAFLDDDQVTDPNWLDVVAGAIRTGGFDAWFGRVIARFADPERTTPMVRALFSRQLEAPTGQELIAFGPNKTHAISLATNNSVFRREAMLLGSGPFDPAFGSGGGEDYDLICRMQQAGSRFGWLAEAQARELVPANRCDPAYLRRRYYAGGQAFANAVSNASSRPLVTRWLIRCKAMVQGALLGLRLPAALARGGAYWTDYTFLMAGVAGKLSFGAIHPIYTRASSASATSARSSA